MGTRTTPLVLLLLLSISSLLPIATPSTVFNFSSFTPNTLGINYSGDSFVSGDNVIQLTRNRADGNLLLSSGHAVYATPIQIRDPITGLAADFTTHFQFNIKLLNRSSYGDGLAFFIAPVGYELPLNSFGSWLGLYNSTTNSSTSTKLVAVEFDTFMNEWDPDGNHIGIDFNSIVSNKTITWNTDIKDENIGSAWIGYNSTSKDLYVYLTYWSDLFNGTPTLSYSLNLMDVLPEKVIVGFSASTGGSTELHQIISWDFISSLVQDHGKYEETAPSKKKIGSWVVGVVVVIVGAFMAILGYILFIRRRVWKKKGGKDPFVLDPSMEDKFVNGTGPRRFSLKELIMATKNFSEDGKLGQGGFGGVYMGILNDNTKEKVAVKKISKGSSQGKKEYISEVTVISRLRHRNLVRLIGWCHEYSELLLVYEYMPNGSLDSHLFGKRSPLAWAARHKIAHGLASALLYLHEEWEQCVVHRDIKSSNVMLDSSFNAKLGDFGLARLVDHELGLETTMLAGTMGYLAPECVTTGKASKESDVYSFGVVALEIACGRKPVDSKAGESKMRLVDWVWEIYGRGKLLEEAADKRLGGDFDEEQMKRLMILGLWCAHPDQKLRPSIRQAIQVMTLEAPLPTLPATVPKPMYYAPPIDMLHFLYTSKTITESGRLTSSADNTSSQVSSRASSGRSLIRASSR